MNTDGHPGTLASKQSELIISGFPLSAKLALLCSPMFLSLPHSWRLLTLQKLSELRPELRLADMFQYLFVEMFFSVLAMPVAMAADAAIGTTTSLLCFMSICCLIPLINGMGVLSQFDEITQVSWLKSATNFMGFGIIASVLERAFFASLMNVKSRAFWLYCFLCYFLSTIWQLVSALILYTPRMFENFYADAYYLMTWIEVIYQCTVSLFILVIYCVIARLKRSAIPAGGNSYRVMLCIYLAVLYSLKMLWARMWRKPMPFKDPFEACEQWYPKHIVEEMRKTFRLFIVIMCLMYLSGLELILRSIWFYQDDNLSRHPKSSFLTILPMELWLLVYVIIFYPITNFLVLPFIKNKLHVQLSDLRLLGIALMFHNLSYISTMALEWRVLSSSVDSPHHNNVAMRIYNCMTSPVAWTVMHQEITPVTIFIPAQMSRTYINDMEGVYQLILNSTVINLATSLNMTEGDAHVFRMREGRLENMTSMDKQLSAKPDFSGDDTHLFVINGLINATEAYLTQKRVEISWKAGNDDAKGMKITSDLTHIILREDTYDITLKLGKATFQMRQRMNDHGVYSVMFYDYWDDIGEGYELDTVSVGFVYGRAWANVQIILLAIGMTIGQIPMVRYTYKNAPAELLPTCYSFHRLACAVSTSLVYSVTIEYGTGPGPSTCSTMVMVLFTVFFIFLSVSDIIPEDDDRQRQQNEADTAADETNSVSMKSLRSMLADPLPESLHEHKSKVTIQSDPERESIH